MQLSVLKRQFDEMKLELEESRESEAELKQFKVGLLPLLQTVVSSNIFSRFSVFWTQRNMIKSTLFLHNALRFRHRLAPSLRVVTPIRHTHFILFRLNITP